MRGVVPATAPDRAAPGHHHARVHGRRGEGRPLVVVVVLDRDVGDVVNGRADRDLVDLTRHLAVPRPGAGRAAAHEPHALVAHVVHVADLDDALVGVDGALDLGLLDLLELRLTRVGDLGRLGLLLVHARGRGDLREQHGFRRLGRAGYGGQHARTRVLERDL